MENVLGGNARGGLGLRGPNRLAGALATRAQLGQHAPVHLGAALQGQRHGKLEIRRKWQGAGTREQTEPCARAVEPGNPATTPSRATKCTCEGALVQCSFMLLYMSHLGCLEDQAGGPGDKKAQLWMCNGFQNVVRHGEQPGLPSMLDNREGGVVRAAEPSKLAQEAGTP